MVRLTVMVLLNTTADIMSIFPLITLSQQYCCYVRVIMRMINFLGSESDITLIYINVYNITKDTGAVRYMWRL